MAGLIKGLHWSPPEGQAANDIQCAHVDSLCVYTAKRLRGVKSKEGGKELWHASIKWLRYDCNPPLDVAPQNMRSIILADRRVWYTMNRKAKSTEAGAGMYEGVVKAKAACQEHFNDWAEGFVISSMPARFAPDMPMGDWDHLGKGVWSWTRAENIVVIARPTNLALGPSSSHVVDVIISGVQVYSKTERTLAKATRAGREYIWGLFVAMGDPAN